MGKHDARLTGPMLWKTAEAFAIATVFCVMMGMSIHHLLAYPGRASSSKVLPTVKLAQLASTTPLLLSSAWHELTRHESLGSRKMTSTKREPTSTTETWSFITGPARQPSKRQPSWPDRKRNNHAGC